MKPVDGRMAKVVGRRSAFGMSAAGRHGEGVADHIADDALARGVGRAMLAAQPPAIPQVALHALPVQP
jgi:hypothetical protein